MRRTAFLLPILVSAAFAAEEPAKPKVDTDIEPANPAMPKGALTGASIFVNPGHGWLWNAGEKRWLTQRGVSQGLIEDHSNAEAVLQYLVPYLEKAGARVYTARERNLIPYMVIVDDEATGLKLDGPWNSERMAGTWNGMAWSAPTTAGAATATATFTPDIPHSAEYAVYAWYRTVTEDVTSVKTSFVINHAGGTTTWVQNQNHDGQTWKYIGTYWFEKGKAGSVVVSNATGADGQRVVVDAIRFGGGVSDTVRGGQKTGRLRYEDSGLYFAEFNGCSPIVESRPFSSVSAMPMWAEWEAEPYEKGKSVYVAWHTNASAKGASRGLSSFIYGPNDWGPVSDFTGYPGGVELVRALHAEVLSDVRAAVEPDWKDVGTICRWLGETNPRNNNKMPAALLEYGFHDNKEDAALIVSPQFRNTAARATYQGIVKYFSSNVDGFTTATLLPEPPTNMSVLTAADGKVTVAWNPPPFNSGDGVLGDAAGGYKLQRSANGYGFDAGVEVTATSFAPANLAEGTTFFRVIATNVGGESWPGETLAVTVPAKGAHRVLLVNGFDRLDREMNLLEPNGAQRGLLRLMNTHNYSVPHAKAIAAAGFGVDSVSDEALTKELLMDGDYVAVVWICGQEKGGEGALDKRERALLAEYLGAGGSLLISGEEIAADLSADGRGDFLQKFLHVKLKADTAPGFAATAPNGSIFNGLAAVAFEGGATGDVYPVRSADALEPQQGAAVALTYQDGTAAAIQYSSEHRVVLLGFPFETIVDEQQRNQVMAKALTFLTGDQVMTAGAESRKPALGN